MWASDLIKRILILPILAGLVFCAPVASAQNSSFQKLLGDNEIPFPFSAFGDWLRSELGAEAVSHAIIPYGRSLHRYTADPNFLRSPRVVLGVTGKGALQNKLFVGYQPASDEIEIISFDEQSGEFVFEVVVDYTEGEIPLLEPASRDVCTGCHQNEGPIFSRGLWGETNANPLISALMGVNGPHIHGFSVQQDIDMVARLDRAIEEANIALAMRKLWDHICTDGAACKSVLQAGLRRAVFGRDAVIEPDDSIYDKLPETVEMPSFRLDNFDPVDAIASGLRDVEIIELADERAGALLTREQSLYYQRPKDGELVLATVADDVSRLFAKRAMNGVIAKLQRCDGQGSRLSLGYRAENGLIHCSHGACSGMLDNGSLILRRAMIDGQQLSFAAFADEGGGRFEAVNPAYLSDGRAVLAANMGASEFVVELQDHAQALAQSVAGIESSDLVRASPNDALLAVEAQLSHNCQSVGG